MMEGFLGKSCEKSRGMWLSVCGSRPRGNARRPRTGTPSSPKARSAPGAGGWSGEDKGAAELLVAPSFLLSSPGALAPHHPFSLAISFLPGRQQPLALDTKAESRGGWLRRGPRRGRRGHRLEGSPTATHTPTQSARLMPPPISFLSFPISPTTH